MLLNRSASGLVVPQHLIEDQTPPSAFVARLQQIFGRDMHVEWNRRKQRWVIEVCEHHNGSDQPNSEGVVVHGHLCRRYYAWMVRDEQTDEYMPLGDRVIEKLHEKETYRKYGVGEESIRRYREESARLDKELQEKEAAKRKQIMRENSKDNRRQWAWLFDMMNRHDMRNNKPELR